MGVLTLTIESKDLDVTKTMKFEPGTMVYDVCRLVHDKLGIQENPNDFGLIRVDDVPSKSFWMENNRKLEYYLIRSGDTLEYKKKIRQLRVRTLDGGTVKTIFVDESQPVSQLMITVCSKMGIANHEEYSLVRDHPPPGVARSRPQHQNGSENGYHQSTGGRGDNAFMSTIGRKKEKQIQQLRAKLHTDEEIHWVDQSKTLREQQIGEHEELTLRRKYFFSDTNVDTRDPVQLNLLYLQCRDGVLSGVHPVSRDTAIKLAALQCFIEYGPFQEGVQKQLNVRELLPKEYAKAKEHEKNIAEEYKEIIYEDQVAPKKKYCELCQSLPTYGVTFFLVKEKLPGKNRLIPRLLGVNKESVMRVDEKTKQVLKDGTPSGPQGVQYGAVSGLVTTQEMPRGERIRYQNPRERAQRALIGTIEQTIRAVEEAEEEILKPPQIDLPHFDTANRRWRVEVEKEAVSDRLAAMGAATAEVVQLTAIPDDSDSRVGVAIATIGSNLPEMGRGVRELAGLLPDEHRRGDLIEATRRLMGAFGNFIDKVHPEHVEKRSNILNAASHVGETTHDVIKTMRDETTEDRQFHDQLIKRAKDVATNTASLVMKAKTISSDCTEPALREQVIHSATQTAFATSELVACARVVAPTIDHPPSQERLTDAAQNVARTVETLLQESNTATQYSASGNGQQNLGDIHAAARLVTESLHDLIDHIKTSPRGQFHRKTQEDYNYEEILRSSNRVITQQPQRDFRDSNNAIRHSRILVEQYENEAADADPNQRDKLLSAARSVAQATSNMISATQEAQNRPQEAQAQMALKSAAEGLVQTPGQNATHDAASGRTAPQTFHRLERAAKDTSAAATQLVTAIHGAERHVGSKRTLEKLYVHSTETGRFVPQVVTAIKESQAAASPADQFRAHSRLIHETLELLPPATRLVEVSRAAVPEVENQHAAQSLQSTSQNLSTHLAELRVALNNAQQVNYEQQLEHVDDLVHELDAQLQAAARDAAHAPPQPPNERAEAQLNASARNVASTFAQLIAAGQSADRQHVGASAVDAAQSLRVFVDDVRHVAPAVKPNLEHLIGNARNVVHDSTPIFRGVRQRAPYTQLKERLDRLNGDLRETLASLPAQASIADAIRRVQQADHERPQGAPVDLRTAGTRVIEAASGLVAGLRQPDQSARVDVFVHSYCQFHTTTRQHVQQRLAAPAEVQIRREVEEQLEVARQSAVDVLQNIRPTAGSSAAAHESWTPAQTQAIAQSTRHLAEAVGRIVDTDRQAHVPQGDERPGRPAPESDNAAWIRECDSALRKIDAARPLLQDTVVVPVNSHSYYESLEAVTESAKRLGDGMKGMAHSAKHDAAFELVRSVHAAADAVCSLAEHTAQSAYLIGTGDPQSKRGRPAPFDAHRLQRAVQNVKELAASIQDGGYTHSALISDITTVATQSSAIATICRDASVAENVSQSAKQSFVNCVAEITQATSSLIGAVKKLDAQQQNAAHRAEIAARAADLSRAAETLEAFVDRPGFSPGPAQVSAVGREAQAPVLDAGRRMLESSAAMIGTARRLVSARADQAVWQGVADNSHHVSESIKRLVATIRDKAPGQSELDAAIDRLEQLIHEVDAASLAAAQHQQPQHTTSEQLVHQQILHASQTLHDRLEPLRLAAQRRAESIAYSVHEHMSAVEPLVKSSIQAAAQSYDTQAQAQLFDQCKTVIEAELRLMNAAKDAGGNPRAVESHQEVDVWVHQVAEALEDLQRSVNLLDSQAGVIDGIVETISRSIAAAEQTKAAAADDSFPNVQTRMVEALEEIRQVANGMPVGTPAELGASSLRMSEAYRRLAEDGRIAHTLLSNPSLAQKLKVAVQKLGTACIGTVKIAGHRRAHPYDEQIHKQLYAAADTTVERVEEVLAALHEGSRGTQACINAANTVSGIIGDLDTTILFATSGSLNQTSPNQRTPADAAEHRNAITKTAQALMEDTKALVTGAASNQEQLAVAAQNAVRTITQLTSAVRDAAPTLSNDSPESQILVIHAVRDVAAALSNLIQATKNASGRNPQDPAMSNLKDSAKSMVGNLKNLLQTVQSMQQKGQHGTYALESAIHAIAFAVKQYDNNELRVDKQATAEEVVRATRAVSEASKRAASTAKNALDQEQVVAAANFARQAVADMLHTTLSAAMNAETNELKFRTIHAGREVAVQVKELLARLAYLLNRPGNAEAEHSIMLASREVYEATAALATCCDTLRTNSWPDGIPAQDPEAVAESELQGAAHSIEAAADKLKQMKPRHVQHHPEQAVEFDVRILQGAQSLVGAVSALVQAASHAQRELVASGRVDAAPGQLHGNDYQWSEGLISAARAVAAAVQQVCEAANGVVQGHASEDKLISASKQVAAHTAQLLMACRVRADANSHNMRRLQTAGHAVRLATERLVNEVTEKTTADDERVFVISDRMVSGIAQVMSAQEEVFRKERELQNAREKLAQINKSRYERTSPEPAD
ncbi:BMA-TLN-1, isoform b [Aphelenchoides fujianensis]|nr:BMA-TLN-1, isoform b [Aphelenchoides fujianensis]